MVKLLTVEEVMEFRLDPQKAWYGIPGIGYFRLIRRGWVLTEVKNLWVQPEKRRQGYGTALLRGAIEFSFTPMLFATVRVDNAPCIRLNEKLGWKRVGEITSPLGNKVYVFLHLRDLCP